MFYVPKCLRKRRSQNHPGDQTILGLRAGASAEKRFVAAVVESKRTEDFAQEGGHLQELNTKPAALQLPDNNPEQQPQLGIYAAYPPN